MNKYILLLFLSLFGTGWSQSITGNILNEHNVPVSNALVQSKTSHTHSDASGRFSLENCKIGDLICISSPEYDSVCLIIKDLQHLQIVLKREAIKLPEILITGNLKHLSNFSKIDLELQPVGSSQDLLRKVPGLFIGQHAGGGKAEQLFLRGFDVDHGTDVNISVDGMPVNMVSHAHGQGYADLHFLIPETVEKIDFDKGTYFADKGDFTTAGYVAFTTTNAVENNTLSMELGQFNTMRTLGIFNLLNTETQSAYVASEYLLTDNYFDAPQNFNRINLFGKYTAETGKNNRLSVSVSHFKSKWDASGQIPERAVKNGTISHFGAIDNTEGGNTGRSSIILEFDKKISATSFIKNTAYFSKYDFELFSNFTFFLNDSVNGDQIKQKENRTIAGFQSEYTQKINPYILFKLGGGLRNDDNKDVELSHTLNRQTVLNYLSLGDINQTNLFGFTTVDFTPGKWLINIGTRLDYFKFNYVDKLTTTYKTLSETKAILSPKLNFMYVQNKNLNYFLKLGKGFHSNDARVVVAQQGKQILPSAYSSDLGLVWKPFPKWMLNTALWYLRLSQEFVYVGDEAIVEPSGRTERKGWDIGLRYQLTKWLFGNADFTYTHARAIDAPSGSDYLPLAPVTTFTGGISVKNLKNISGSIRTRLLGDRSANEDHSVIAKGYCITDISVNYQFKKLSVGINIDNLFNTTWKETQFLTESRLFSETNPVEEIHYTAGTPFNAKLIVKYNF